MRYNEFKLTEGYKEVQQKFSQEADPTKVAAAFDVFKKLVSANRISGQERNIDWWGKQGWSAFAEYVTAIDERPSSSEQKSRKNKGTSHVLEESAKWLIVVPLDKDSSCFHGKKSDWCVTKSTQNNFEGYFRDDGVTLIFFFRQSDGAMWAMSVYPNKRAEYFDQKNETLSVEEFNQQTGLDSNKYAELVGGETEVGQAAAANREVMKDELKTLQDYIKKLEQMSEPRRSAKIETMLLKVKDEKLIKKYLVILHQSNGPVELDQQLQTLVATNGARSIKYLKGVTAKTIKQLEHLAQDEDEDEDEDRSAYEIFGDLQDLTKEALAYIASKSYLSLAYALHVVDGPWPPGEAAIAKDPDISLEYAQNVIGGRFPAGEPAMASDENIKRLYKLTILDQETS
jgi:hypothetical protein